MPTEERDRSICCGAAAAARRCAPLSVGAFAVGFAAYKFGSPLNVREVTDIQSGGGSQPLPLPPGTRRDAYWDLALIAGYTASFWEASRLARFWPGGSRGRVVRPIRNVP